MLEADQLHRNLETASNRHKVLFEKFGQFANSVKALVSNPQFHIKGIGVSLNLDQGYFSTSFAGRTLHLRFESTAGEHGSLVGKVTCYRQTDFPTQVISSIGDFQFKGTGETNPLAPAENKTIFINDDLQGLHIVLNYIHESLAV